MDWQATLTPVILAVLTAILGLGMKWLGRQKWAQDAEREMFLAIEGAAQRVKDKYLAEIMAAKDAASDGGATVTPKEMSDARQKAFDIVLQSLKGPVLDYAKGKCEALLKGWIGTALDKILPHSGAPTPVDSSKVGQ